eukprot:NODE_2995_length_997_cov_16.771097_g2268_i1.p1 GENE.NODE_2995_length_997_cov_16.771097_g2268_i1~~NODE_2995_length_997_cov_16.771097_g2268_i1.p1  ORF type:complete len:314 (+),score=27.87 NODE_2995_length_997_cov_16.771097_g2268_i1:24-944(+)
MGSTFADFAANGVDGTLSYKDPEGDEISIAGQADFEECRRLKKEDPLRLNLSLKQPSSLPPTLESILPAITAAGHSFETLLPSIRTIAGSVSQALRSGLPKCKAGHPLCPVLSPGALCDECHRPISGGSFGCREHDYDLCMNCATWSTDDEPDKDEDKPEPVVACKAGHPLNCGVAGPTILCDVCDRRLLGQVAYGCRLHDYDLCQQCATQPRSTVSEQPESPQPDSAVEATVPAEQPEDVIVAAEPPEEVRNGPVTCCPRGHEMEFGETHAAIVCGACTATLEAGSLCFKCSDFVVCCNCRFGDL